MGSRPVVTMCKRREPVFDHGTAMDHYVQPRSEGPTVIVAARLKSLSMDRAGNLTCNDKPVAAD